MFYSKYSNYSPEQIISKDFEKLSSILLSIVKDAKTKEIMERNTV